MNMRTRAGRRSLVVLLAAVAIGSATTAATAAPQSAIPVPPQTLTQPQPPDLGAIVAVPESARTAPLDAPMPLDPRITVGRLDNGLHYWIRENSYPAKRAELRLVIKVGSMQEDEDQLGLAHFVEHMAFNGTANYPKMELVKALESFGMRFGADVNASTGFDETIYFLRIPTDDAAIVDSAFQILEDWAHSVAFDDAEIDKERGVVIEEWRLGLGAGSRLRDVQFPVLFSDSRYADRLPIGKVEVLEEFEHEAARRFYRDWYRPELMGVIVVGDLDTELVEGKIREHFGKLRNPDAPRERVFYDVPRHVEPRFSIDSDPEATISTVVVYHKLPLRPQAYHGSYRQTIVEGLYNNMLNRRLAELAQQPNPPFLGAQSEQGIFIPTSEVYFIGAAVPDGGVARGLQALYAELERVHRYGFTDTELEREKAQLLRGFERIYAEKDVQDSGLFAEEFTRAFLEGESTPGIDYEWELYQRFLPEITLEEVNAVGQSWITDENRVVLVSTPEREGLTPPTREELMAALDRADDEWIRPYVDTVTDAPLLDFDPEPGSIVEESRVEELNITEWKLSNGVRVVLKPTDFRQEQILFRAFSSGGTSLAADEDLVAAQSATQVVMASGFGPFSARQLTNLLADKVANVRPFFGPLEEGLVGNASPRDIATLFQLVYLMVNEPRADSGIFNLIRDQMAAGLANQEVSPESAWQEALQRTLSQDHPRRRPVSVELLQEMNLEKSYDFYVERFADFDDFTFVFVGNLDVEAMRPLAEKYLATLPVSDRVESWRDEGVRLPRGVIEREVRQGLEPKSITAIVATNDLTLADEQQRTLAAMAEVLQTRLREVMREDLSGTYGVSVDAEINEKPARELSVSISFGSDPERVAELTQVVFEQIRRLQAEAPTMAEVDAVLETFRRARELDIKENGFWLSRLADLYREGKDPREILGFEERLRSITPEGIREVAAQAIDAQSYVRVVLRPEQ